MNAMSRPIYWILLSVALWALMVCAISLIGNAFAHDPGHNAALTEWLMQLENKHHFRCCTGDDALPAEAEYDIDTGHYRARIMNPVTKESEWYEVPDWAVIDNQPNRLGYSAIWFYWDMGLDGKRTVRWRCFLAGSGT